jgi:hypothetical protein
MKKLMLSMLFIVSLAACSTTPKKECNGLEKENSHEVCSIRPNRLNIREENRVRLPDGSTPISSEEDNTTVVVDSNALSALPPLE